MLIELLWRYEQMRMMRISIEECTDHLIANGVTIATKDDFPDTLTEQAYCNGKAAMREAVIGKLMDAKTVARGAEHALLADIIQMVRDLEV